MANLRQIGCPEQTVRDIITADVHALYAPRLASLKAQRGSLANGLPNRIVNPVEAELKRLESEEAAVLAELFGEAEASRPAAADNSQVPSEMPLVFQEVDSSRMVLNNTQIETINELRQRFWQSIGGPNQDPESPGYRERWNLAQRENDEMLGGLLGGEFFLDLQLSSSAPQPNR